MRKVFRGKVLNVKVENPNGNQKGIKELYVNGAKLDDMLIADSILKDENEVRIVM